MKVRQIILTLVFITLLIVSAYGSIYLHEYIHVKQFEKLGIETTGINIANSYGEIVEMNGALGWVSIKIYNISYYEDGLLKVNKTASDINIANLKTSYETKHMREREAYLIQSIVMFVLFFISFVFYYRARSLMEK